MERVSNDAQGTNSCRSCNLTILASLVSYEEFLSLFRSEQTSFINKAVSLDYTMSCDDESLLGLDAKIPGGKYDSRVRANNGS